MIAVVGQGRNYSANADPCAIITVFRIFYGKSTPNKKRANKAVFSTAWNVTMPIEYYLFPLEECYVILLIAHLAYTMEQIVDKALITIQSTGLFYQALLEWNGLLLKNKTWSELKSHFC